MITIRFGSITSRGFGILLHALGYHILYLVESRGYPKIVFMLCAEKIKKILRNYARTYIMKNSALK